MARQKTKWEAVNGAVYTIGPTPTLICTMNPDAPPMIDLKHAQMIAAAPDLKAALKGIIDAYGGDVPDWLEDEFAAAEDAVSKAEGRS